MDRRLANKWGVQQRNNLEGIVSGLGRDETSKGDLNSLSVRGSGLSAERDVRMGCKNRHHVRDVAVSGAIRFRYVANRPFGVAEEDGYLSGTSTGPAGRLVVCLVFHAVRLYGRREKCVT